MKYFFTLVLLLVLVYPNLAQTQPENTIRHSKATLLGKSSPVADWGPGRNHVDDTRKSDTKKARKEIPNFKGNKPFTYKPEGTYLPKKGDPVLQYGKPNKNIPIITMGVNVDGIDHSDSGSFPPDCNGDIGLNFYMETTNGNSGSQLFIFDKDGNIVLETDMNYLWQELGVSTFGDPVVLFDRLAQRWVITEFSAGGNELYMAVTESDDPFGAFNAYAIPTADFPDYPKYGAWDDAYFITTNEYLGYNPVYAIDKEAMLNGESEVTIIEFVDMTKFGSADFFQVSTPINLSGANLPGDGTEFMAIRIFDDAWEGTSGPDRLEYYTFNPDFETPDNSAIEGPFDLFPEAFDTQLCDDGLFQCVTQSNGQKLSVIPNTIMNKVQYYNFGTYESILLCFSVDINGEDVAGVRWMELRKDTENDWYIYQESTLASDDGNSRFMGSITQDLKGNIALLYAMAGPTVDASLAVSARLNSSALGSMDDEVILAEGKNPSSIFRWGDYFSLTLDPVDYTTFWFTGQYVPDNLEWSTKVGSFSLRRDTIDARVSTFISPTTADNLTTEESVTIEVFNQGYDTLINVPVGFYFEGNFIEEGTLLGKIAPLESASYTFLSTLDMNEIKSYELVSYTAYEGDQFLLNDTLRKIVKKLPRLDLGLSLAANNDVFSCEEEYPFELKIKNQGTDTIKNYTLIILVEGTESYNEVVNSTIFPGDEESQIINLTSLQLGNNTIEARVTLPNNLDDQLPADNFQIFETEYNPDATRLNLSFTSDQFGEDVSWEIVDENVVVLYSGGEYPLGGPAIENLEYCLNDGCYIFKLYDSYGDGWYSTDNPELIILDENGVKLVEMIVDDFNFGTYWDQEFCVPFACNIDAEYVTTPASAEGVADGTILIDLLTFNDGVMYSISGGAQFQTDPLFTGLIPGEYDIVVEDQYGCTFTTFAIVDVNTSTQFETNNIKFTVSPNPNDGYMKLHLQGLNQGQTLAFTILNQSGRQVFSDKMQLFSDGYHRNVWLTDAAAGTYYIYIQGTEHRILEKIVLN